MNKTELIETIATDAGISKATASRVVNSMMDTITN